MAAKRRVGRIGLAGGDLDQQVGRRAGGERRGHPGMAHDELQAGIGEELEGVDRCQGAAQDARGRDRGGGIGEADHAHRPMAQLRHQAQPDPRDHGERPLAAGQQPPDVVAGVVLRDAGQAAHDGAIGQDGLEAEELRAHRSVADDVHAAGVRGDHAADRGGVPGSQVDPDLPAGGSRGALDRRQGRARADGDLARARIDLADLVEPQQAEHDLAAARHRSADEAGVAALRDDARSRRRRRPAGSRRPRRSMPGRTTARAAPWKRRVQSVSYDARSAGSVRQCRSPTTSRRAVTSASELIGAS